jgi:ribosomal protein S18 acetylase RimI-like enzyme
MSRIATDDVEASDAALRSVLERFGRCGRGAWITNGLLLTCGPVGSVGSYAHTALPLSRDCDAREVLQRAREHARRCEASVVLWVSAEHNADLREAAGADGLSPAGSGFERPGMIARETPPIQASRAVTVEPVRDPRVFARVVAAAYAHRGVSAEAAFALLANPRLLAAAGTHMLLALLEREPVASVLGFIDGPVGVLSWIGTVPHARGRGIAKLVTAAAVHAAMAHGARVVGLQATEEGEPLYRQLGFTEATRYVRYVVEPTITD